MTTHRPRSIAATALGLATCLLLAACSSGSSPTHATANTPAARAPAGSPNSRPAASIDSPAAAANGSACGLVTASEAGAVTDKAMGPGADAGVICSYSATADPSNVVYVQLYTDARSIAVQKQTEPGGQHLPGLGDDAFWNPGIVFVQKGTRAFSITVPALSLASRTAPEAMLALAKIAAGRL